MKTCKAADFPPGAYWIRKDGAIKITVVEPDRLQCGSPALFYDVNGMSYIASGTVCYMEDANPSTSHPHPA